MLPAPMLPVQVAAPFIQASPAPTPGPTARRGWHPPCVSTEVCHPWKPVQAVKSSSWLADSVLFRLLPVPPSVTSGGVL